MNPQLSRTSRTSTCTHRQLSSCSWAVKKKKSGFSLPGSRPWSDFFASLFHLTLCEQPHSLSVCGDSVWDAHLASRRYSDSLSHTLSLFQVRSGPSRHSFSFFFCLEKSQRIERLCPIQARTTALLNQPQAQLTDDRCIDMHGNPQSLRLIKEKFFPGKQISKILAFSKNRYNSGIANAFRKQVKQKSLRKQQDRAGERRAVTADQLIDRRLTEADLGGLDRVFFEHRVSRCLNWYKPV